MNDWVNTEEYRNLSEMLANEINPVIEKIKKCIEEDCIIDIEEDDIELVIPDNDDLVEDEPIECETEDMGNKRNGIMDAMRFMTDSINNHIPRYTFMNNLIKNNK